MPPSAALRADADRLLAAGEMERLRVLLEAREQSLQGTLTARDLAASVQRQHLKIRMREIEQQVTMAQARLDNLKGKVDIGLASPLDVKRAEVELLERKLELEKLQKELASISGGKE